MVSSDRNQINRELLVAALGDDWPADLIQTAAEMLADSESRFPSGPRRLPGDLVRAIQRERLLVGMLRAVSELGYRSTNVQDVIEGAGVSRPTFYEHFSNKDDCFLAAFDTCAARLRDRVATAADSGGEIWRDRMRSGFNALLTFTEAEPEAARMVIVEARAATQDATIRRVALLDHFATCIDDKVRELLPAGTTHSAVTASGVVGGVESLLYARLNKNEMDDLPALLPSLMYFAVLPYEGHLAASEELGLRSA
ncbi:MAG TPA: TetR/AcrR family transcriptional regulator [Solirubrobacterales bacterium]|nr:TetR/AcrR family transcriptional regulator [Solirubrobacterales bacterium]